jgi:hypothetical protein
MCIRHVMRFPVSLKQLSPVFGRFRMKIGVGSVKDDDPVVAFVASSCTSQGKAMLLRRFKAFNSSINSTLDFRTAGTFGSDHGKGGELSIIQNLSPSAELMVRLLLFLTIVVALLLLRLLRLSCCVRFIASFPLWSSNCIVVFATNLSFERLLLVSCSRYARRRRRRPPSFIGITFVDASPAAGLDKTLSLYSWSAISIDDSTKTVASIRVVVDGAAVFRWPSIAVGWRGGERVYDGVILC